jgi:membrane protein YqaA with SNARE-associated domain
VSIHQSFINSFITKLFRRLREILKAIKNWVEGFAQKPYALWALFVISFIEASIFPLPPDVLLVALGVTSPKKSLRYAFVTALGSFFGAYLGYYIGFAGFELIGKPILTYIGVMQNVAPILAEYHKHGLLALILSGYTPVPYIVFTMAAGFNSTLDLLTLTIGGAIGRFSRFMLVGGLLFYFGPPVKVFIDKYFERLSIAFAAVIILLIVIVKILV